MSYQGPHVAVIQRFDSAPGAVAVEGLPAAIVGSSYEVFSNSVIGELKTASVDTFGFGTTKKVIYDETVAGKRVYDFYKPRVEISVGGKSIELTDVTVGANGFTMPAIPTYEITTADAGSMPMAKVTVVTSGTDKITVKEDVRLYGITPGQYVANGTTAVGTILSISGDGKTITLETNLSATIAADVVLTLGVKAATGLETFANTIAFTGSVSGVRVGDIIEFYANIDGTRTKYESSIVRIFDNGRAFEINTAAIPTEFTSITGVKTFQKACGGFTVKIDSIKFKRLAAYADCTAASVTGTATANKFTVTAANMAGKTIVPGNVVKMTGGTQANVIGVVANGADTDVILDKPSVAGAFAVFAPRITTTVRAFFRTINIGTTETVNRITSPADIEAYYGPISPFNELAFMLAQARLGNGGKVVYARNVSPDLSVSASQYAAAIEDLKMFDVYSHAFGTTDFAIVGGVSSYVNQQSEPYRAHERIARVVYDADEAYTMLRKTDATGASTTITIAGASTAGCGLGEILIGYDSTGKEIGRKKIIATPSDSAVTIESAFTGTIAKGAIIAGNKYKQAQQIASLSAIDNRRVKIMCPGYFAGTIDGIDFDAIPPYFLSAFYAGADDGLVVSQSFTNFGFAPGITNMKLATDTYFQVDDLDVIGAAGIDILIQDGVQITNTIQSRHDLTTDMFDILSREWSVVKQVDLCAKTLRKVARKYVGKYNITPRLLSTVQRNLKIAAKSLVDADVIFALQVVSVERSKEVADKVLVGVKATAYIAGNYYDITINVGV